MANAQTRAAARALDREDNRAGASCVCGGERCKYGLEIRRCRHEVGNVEDDGVLVERHGVEECEPRNHPWLKRKGQLKLWELAEGQPVEVC